MMFYIKFCLFCIVLTLYQVEAEILEKDETTHSVELLQSTMVKNATVTENQSVLKNISNDIEIFDAKVGPQNEKQEEEEPVAETEVEEDEQPAAEELKEEEEAEAENKPAADADPEPGPTAEEEAEAAPEAEAEADAEPAAASEEPKEEEISTETEKEPGTASEPVEDKETVKPDDKPNSTEGAAESDDNEMPKDEPAKDEEQDKAAEDATKHTEQKETSCFTCTSIEDATCTLKATQQMACLKTNGCYTLYQADKNITTRGCVDELAEDGLKYCLENEKICTMCYSNGCNDKEAPSIATKLQLNIFLLFLFAAFSLKFKAFPSLTFE